jgi:hypothetical protein
MESRQPAMHFSQGLLARTPSAEKLGVLTVSQGSAALFVPTQSINCSDSYSRRS